MTPFQDRLDTAMRLELAFIKTFNELCDSYKIVQYGIESTKLMDAHDFIRSCRDDTSRFVRYIPDSVLVHTKHPTVCNTTLVEFKAATTGVQKKEFMEYLSRHCPNMQPPFNSKDDIFNIENDALELYLKLQSIGVRIIVVAYAGYRTNDDQIRAQFVEHIARCNVYDPNQQGQNTGSGTPIANVNFASFVPLTQFFREEFGIDDQVVNCVYENVQKEFNHVI
jgi:hypothetical protein